MTDVSHKLLKIRRFSHLQNQYSWVRLPSGAPIISTTLESDSSNAEQATVAENVASAALSVFPALVCS